jgi:hypothetical protein
VPPTAARPEGTRTLASEQKTLKDFHLPGVPPIEVFMLTDPDIVIPIAVAAGKPATQDVDGVLVAFNSSQHIAIEFFLKGCSVSGAAVMTDDEWQQILAKAMANRV